MSDLMTKPPLAQWLKGAEVAFKKKFLGEKHTIRDENAHPTHHTHLPAHLPTHPLGEKLYEMINEDPVKICEVYILTYLKVSDSSQRIICESG